MIARTLQLFPATRSAILERPMAYRLDRLHPMARDVSLCAVLGHGIPFDLATELPLTASGTPDEAVNEYGRSVLFDTTTDYYTAPIDQTLIIDGNGSTACYVRRCTDTTARASSTFGNTPLSGSNTTTRWQNHLPYSDGNYYCDFANGTAGSGRLTGAWGGKSTTIETIIHTGGTGGNKLWKNGTQVASNAASVSFTVPTGNFTINRFTNTDFAAVNGDLQEMCLFIVWRRQLEDDQLVRISADPFCMIVPRLMLSLGKAPIVAGTSIPVFMHNYRRRRVA